MPRRAAPSRLAWAPYDEPPNNCVTSKENLALAAANAAARTGCVVGFTNQGTHVAGSYHYRDGTGDVGLATDFDAPGTNPALLLACADFFLGYAPQLAELFHSRLPVFVKNGKTYPIASLDRSVYLEHFNHVHVAVNKGTFLAPKTPPVPTPPAPAGPSLPGSIGPVLTTGDAMQRVQVTTPSLDGSGNGYVDTQIPWDHIVNVLPYGPSPDRDGYGWPNWYWSVNDTNNQARIEVEGATPHGQVSFAVWSVS